MKLHHKIFTLTAVLAAIITPAHATITLTFEAQQLLQGGLGSNPAAVGSLVLVVADTTGAGFNTLQAGPITVGSTIDQAGNDLVVGLSSIQADIFAGNAPVFDYLHAYTLSGAWDTGDPLAIYWIPSETTANTTVGHSVAYGEYTDATGLNGSIPWITPSDPGTYNPMLFSTSGIFGTGNVSASAGYASLSTPAIAVPEPSTFALLGGVVGLAAAALRRRKVTPAPVA